MSGQAADQGVLVLCRFVLGRLSVPCFNDEREGTRPFELEGNLDEHVSRNRVDVVNLGTRGTIRARWFWVDDVL